MTVDSQKDAGPATIINSGNGMVTTAGSSRSKEWKATAWWVPVLHTVFASTAFALALVVGCKLHYYKIVKNEHYGYPEEWFPSVSATIGDRYPERNIFQIFIALTCPPRLFLLGGWYYLCMSSPSSVGKTNRVPLALFVIGFLRTVTCGGWVYVTSGDDHDVHDVMMISYMLLTLPYMIMMIKTGSNRTLTSYVAPEDAKVSTRRRKIVCKLFFGIIPPMIWFFIRHKVHKIPGAYTHYAFFEWSLIVLDVLFDYFAVVEFRGLELGISHSKGAMLRD